MKSSKIIMVLSLIIGLFLPFSTFAANATPAIAGIQVDFIIFALTLVGVALFHNKTMYVALIGLSLEVIVKLSFDSDFSVLEHITGNAHHEGEWRTILNLIGLLFGFAILAKIFEESGVPNLLPKYLPSGWTGGLVLLFIVFVLSSFLDNIAAAIIGGTIAMTVYKGRVHIGYIAGIIAASNAGGAGSVVGDTTTTLMWIDGVNAAWVLKAFVGAFFAILFFGYFAAKQQHKYQPISSDFVETKIAWKNIYVVILILVLTIAANYFLDFPAIGVWAAILIGALFIKMPWHELKAAFEGTIFLSALVFTASLMPVDQLPDASAITACSLGFVSAVFDNIPLTKLCLQQGGYDWGILSFAVGFGGSMVWFGSSAGVALTNIFPQARSVGSYLKHGWHVIVGYIIGFMIMIAITSWEPKDIVKSNDASEVEAVQSTH